MRRKRLFSIGVWFVGLLLLNWTVRAEQRIWDRDNLFAWTVAPFDATVRSPEERVQMLADLGFKSYAYSWRERHIPTFDAEIIALKRHNIDLFAWHMLAYEISDTRAKAALDAIRRHNLHPWLWVGQSLSVPASGSPRFADFLPSDFPMPNGADDMAALSTERRAQWAEARRRWYLMDFPKGPREQEERVKREAARIRVIVEVATANGCKVALYNHNGWFGMVENQLAIIEHLRKQGVTGIGIVYNFSHARDELHDDSINFPALWSKIQKHVIAVTITGMKSDGWVVYPSQGDGELEMMRTIEDSGWRGPVGVIAEKGGDAAETLRNYIIGLTWLAAEIKQPGSGGARPFPPAP